MEEMSKTAMETIVDYNQQDDTAHVFFRRRWTSSVPIILMKFS